MSAVFPLQRADSKSNSPSEVCELIRRLLELRSSMIDIELEYSEALSRLRGDALTSARNLLHYVALRRHDLRELQDELGRRGLSSLGRCEPHVIANVDAVLGLLCALDNSAVKLSPPNSDCQPLADFSSGRQLLDEHTRALLGTKPHYRDTHIMVTMPREAATDPALVRNLVESGMSVMRINCAHDDQAAWLQMISNLRRAECELGRHCRVMMDLGGPKLRTGVIADGPQVLKWRPTRDTLGRIVSPARIWLTASDDGVTPPYPADASLPVGRQLLKQLFPGVRIRFRDASGRRRQLIVLALDHGGVWALSEQTTYMVSGIELVLERKRPRRNRAAGKVGELPATDVPVVVYKGDQLIISDNGQAGEPASYAADGSLLQPARISCTLPEVLGDVRVGHAVLIDDGKISGIVREAHPHYLVLEITSAAARGARIRSDKGLNFPDSDLRLDSLTPKDRHDLDFIVQHADLVGYSFVRQAEDVECLQRELAGRGGDSVGIVLKIENQRACERLPELLLTVLRTPAAGVMIARGDLAVECGYQRLAELQEEILWICESAHIPVIWATQVLEQLTKEGIPTRAEITDAAMSVRAECVMLNKGPHVVEAVCLLDDILVRMQGHQRKKNSRLRHLRLADRRSRT